MKIEHGVCPECKGDCWFWRLEKGIGTHYKRIQCWRCSAQGVVHYIYDDDNKDSEEARDEH